MADLKETETKVAEEPKVTADNQATPQNEGPPTPPANDLQSPTQWFNSYFGSDWVSKAKEQVHFVYVPS